MRGSTSRAGRSSRRRRSPPGRRRVLDPPPRRCPTAGRPPRSGRRAPSRGRRRRRCATRGRAAARRRSSDRCAKGKPSLETSSPVTLARMSRARGPQSPRVHHAEVSIGELCGAVAGQVVAEPLAVGHAVRAARDDPELLVAEPHDREVGLEAAAGREPRRVDDPADRDVDLPLRHVLEGVERSRPGDVEDRERGEVEDRGPLAHGEMLRVDDRRPPASVPLRLAAADPVAELLEQRRVRLVPLRALPARRLEEDGVELALARVERREADVAVGRPLLGGVDDPVRLVEALGGARLDVRARPMMLVKAGDVRGVEVDLGLAVHHPLGQALADARALLHPDGGRRPQAARPPASRRGSASRRG